MEYKTPKALEKKPVIAGFDLKTIVIIAVTALLSLFTVFTSIYIPILLILITISYIKIQKKYPERDEFLNTIKYTTSIKCIRINKPITSLIKTNK